MAAPAAITSRVTIGLDALDAMLADLRQYRRLWPKMSEAEQASWSMDWTQLISSYLPEIEDCYQNGTLQPPERNRYRRLRRTLVRLHRAIDRLQLTPPPDSVV